MKLYLNILDLRPPSFVQSLVLYRLASEYQLTKLSGRMDKEVLLALLIALCGRNKFRFGSLNSGVVSQS